PLRTLMTDPILPLDTPPPPAPAPPVSCVSAVRPNGLAIDFDSVPAAFRSRVAMTVSCTDADSLPRVHNAGEVIEHSAGSVQVMHNGVLVEEGCYYGTITNEIIRCLRGVHEPQEEVAFAAIMQRLTDTAPTNRPPTMIELGSFWAYYSLWFLNDFPEGNAICLEPDAHHLEVGKRNFALNNRNGTFLNAAIGTGGGTIRGFVTETNPNPVDLPSHDLDSLLAECNIDTVDVLLSDIQGFEVPLFLQASERLRQGAARFLVISTHDLSITGSATTHQQVLDILLWSGAHIIAEHSVSESFSGDGLIVASFDPRDRDMKLSISHNRSRNSLFGEWEPRAESYRLQLHEARQEIEALKATLANRVQRKARNVWQALRS
ncbi:MAG: FkbM family methyltransferase, partial [Acidimicrobiales bacterium]